MKKTEPFKLPFPPYDVTKSDNTVVVVITDEITYDENTDQQIGTVAKTQADADSFMIMLHGLCRTHGFQINGTGTKEQMAGRLYKKNGQNLLTETEVLECCLDISMKSILDSSHIPIAKDVSDWVAKRNKRRAENE